MVVCADNCLCEGLLACAGLAPEWSDLADAEELRWWLQAAADNKER